MALQWQFKRLSKSGVTLMAACSNARVLLTAGFGIHKHRNHHRAEHWPAALFHVHVCPCSLQGLECATALEELRLNRVSKLEEADMAVLSALPSLKRIYLAVAKPNDVLARLRAANPGLQLAPSSDLFDEFWWWCGRGW